jgi:hypothetical protein
MVVERSPAVSQTAQPEKSTQDGKGKAPATDDDDGEGWENFREDPVLTGAARQAHFDPAVLDKNHVRHRTGKVYRQSLNASAEWTTPADLGEDDEATYDDFVQLFPDGTINKALWSLNSEDLSRDLVDRLEEAARHCTGPDGPRFPFEPWTEEGKRAWPDVEGIVGDEFFEQAMQEHPEEIYQELKLRTLLAHSLRQQRDELQKHARGTSQLVLSLLSWIRHLNGPNSGPTREITDLMAENLQKNEQIAELNATIAALAIRKTKAKTDKAGKQAPIPTVEDDDNRTENRPTHEARATHSEPRDTPASIRETLEREHRNALLAEAGTKSSKSTKLPDPQLWHNDPEKDGIDFDNWYHQLEGKLLLNADHYPTELAKIVYIRSRLTGDAALQLKPYFPTKTGSGTDGTVSTHEELLALCRREWGNPHEAEEARQHFRNLSYKPGDDWNRFKNSFVRYAGESKRPRSEWKLELKDKIEIPSLLKKLADDFADPNVSFDEICEKCSRQALVTKMLKNRERRKETPAGTSESRGRQTTPTVTNSRACRGSSTRESTPANQKVASLPPMSKDDLARHMATGTCFTCSERGHMSRDCPKNPTPRLDARDYRQRNEARINAVYERLYGKQEEDMESESENE